MKVTRIAHAHRLNPSKYRALAEQARRLGAVRFDGVVLQADENAARNVLARLCDPEIDRWTPYRRVKSILQARTERLRLGLLNPDSSCSPVTVLSTESELLENINAQLCAGF